MSRSVGWLRDWGGRGISGSVGWLLWSKESLGFEDTQRPTLFVVYLLRNGQSHKTVITTAMPDCVTQPLLYTDFGSQTCLSLAPK